MIVNDEVAEKDLMTHHLLTGILSSKVVDKVLEKASSMLSVDASNTLRQLWNENLSRVGNLPLTLDPSSTSRMVFDIEANRRSSHLTEVLPPITYQGLLQRPAVHMKRPVIEISENRLLNRSKQVDTIGPHVERAYIMKQSDMVEINTLSSLWPVHDNNKNKTPLPLGDLEAMRNALLCTEEEAREARLYCRHGTRVLVLDHVTTGATIREPQGEWKWRTARVIQFHNEIPADYSDKSRDQVRVRFVDKYIESRKGWHGGDGYDTERTVTWASRELKLYHTERYKQEREALEQQSISINSSSINSSSISSSSSSSRRNRSSEGPTLASDDEGASEHENRDIPIRPTAESTTATVTTAGATESSSSDAAHSMNESMAFSEKTLILSGLRDLDGLEELQGLLDGDMLQSLDDIQGLGLGLGQALDEMQGLGLSGQPQEDEDAEHRMHDDNHHHEDEDGADEEEGGSSEERVRERRLQAQRRAMEAAEAQWRAGDEEQFFARLQRDFTYNVVRGVPYKSTQQEERMTDIDERDIWGECERLYEYGTENEYARNEVALASERLTATEDPTIKPADPDASIYARVGRITRRGPKRQRTGRNRQPANTDTTADSSNSSSSSAGDRPTGGRGSEEDNSGELGEGWQFYLKNVYMRVHGSDKNVDMAFPRCHLKLNKINQQEEEES